MGILSTVKHWFNRGPALAPAQVFLELMQRGNAIYAANPDRLARAVTAWNSGYIAELARIVDEYEIRDDVARIGVRKRDAAVARCEHTVLIEEGHEGEERAELHRRVLKEFWSGITVTSAFNRSQRGGIRLLKKQMMGAQSVGWSCHNIVWDTSDPDHLTAKFIHVPLWHFENLTGELRFKPTVNQYYGVPMEPGSWLVHSGDAIGPAVALAACAKHMGLQDWLLFSERAAIPGLLAKTGAQIGTEAWNKLCEMLEAWGRDWKAVTDRDTDITTVSLNGNGTPPMPGLVERMDRAIAALYRGADLSTISKGEGLGASLQGEEADMLEADDCAALAESLHEQVDRYVIRWATGDRVPLAYIWIEPTKRPDIEGRIKVNEHLIAHGAKLSMRDELNWFGRTEADESDAEDRAMTAASKDPQNPVQEGLNGLAAALANESAFKTALGAFKTASSKPDGQVDPSSLPPSQIAKNRPSRRGDESGSLRPTSRPSGERAVIEAFIEQNTPAAEAVKKVLADPTPSAFATLLGNLPELLPEDPALASVIADAMAKEFEKSGLANEFREEDHPRAADGKFTDGLGGALAELSADKVLPAKIEANPDGRPVRMGSGWAGNQSWSAQAARAAGWKTAAELKADGVNERKIALMEKLHAGIYHHTTRDDNGADAEQFFSPSHFKSQLLDSVVAKGLDSDPEVLSELRSVYGMKTDRNSVTDLVRRHVRKSDDFMSAEAASRKAADDFRAAKEKYVRDTLTPAKRDMEEKHFRRRDSAEAEAAYVAARNGYDKLVAATPTMPRVRTGLDVELDFLKDKGKVDAYVRDNYRRRLASLAEVLRRKGI